MASSNKKNLDKDYVFNLIMPSAPEYVNTEEEEKKPLSPEDSDVPDAKQQPNTLSILESNINKAFSASSVKLSHSKELSVINLMENLVAERLDAAFEKFNCCRCDKCKKDVAALALNYLQPKYVVADADELAALLQECSTKEVSAALIKAILQIKNHPMH